jgi:hypothetical protein
MMDRSELDYRALLGKPDRARMVVPPVVARL